MTRCKLQLLAFFLLLGSATAANALVDKTPSQADLRRAKQKRPGLAFLGSSPQHLGKVLNGHLQRRAANAGASIISCEDASMSELDQLLQQLLELNHADLDKIYQATEDRRSLAKSLGGVGDPKKLLTSTLRADLALLARRPELSAIVRDSKCRLVVMWFVHHLPEAARAKAFQLPGFRLPLLPSSGLDDMRIQMDGNDVDQRQALEAYSNRSMCMPCHIDGSESPAPAPPAPVPGHEGPSFVRWPDSVNYTLYAGMSGCCSPTNNYTEIRKIARRWKQKQQLDINLYVDCQTFMKPSFVHECSGGGYATEDKTCMLDECHAGQIPEYAQHAGCHIFYNGTAIWEFWPSLRRCTKLTGGAGLPAPWGLTDSFDALRDLDYLGLESMGDAPDVTKNRTCHKWCERNASGPPGTTPQCYWMHKDGTPCKHHFPDGIDFYGSSANGDWVEVEDDGPLLSKLPDYCPPEDTPALLPPMFPNQDKICTQWWFDKSDQGTIFA